MATNPDQSQRQHEAELAAALILLGRRYDLPAVIRANRIRTRRFRQIRPTEALRSSMAAPYMDLVRAWAAQSPVLMTAYERALVTGDLAIVQRQVEASADDVARQLAILERRFPAVLADLERWHRLQYLSRIKASTGLDVGMFTSPSDVATDTSNATAWNEQLIDDVHQQAKAGVSAALLAGVAVSTPVSTVRAAVSGVLGKSKKRGLRIGVDQVDRTVEAMTRSRSRAAGLDSWRWHHTPQMHPRDEHLARDGRVYTIADQPNDLPGVLPFCKCWEEPLWE